MTRHTVDHSEEQFLICLGEIDLHHGPLSSAEPYTSLDVLGVSLTSNIQASLLNLGFNEFVPRPGGFTATRSPNEAARIRI